MRNNNIYNRAKHMGVIYTLIGGICWGFSATSGQYLMSVGNIDSKLLTVIRLVVSGLVLSCIALITNRQKAVEIFRNKKDFMRLVIFAIFGLLICQYTYLSAIYYSNAGTATVLQYLGPILIVVYVCIKSLKMPTKKEIACILLAILGTFILATHGNIKELIISKEGLFWGLSSAVGLMLYTLLPGGLINKYGAIIITGYGMTIGGFMLLLLTRAWQYNIIINNQVLLGLFGVVGLGTIVAFTLYLKGVSIIGPVKASLIACIEPVSAVFLSAVLLKTSFAPIDLVGVALVLAAVVILSRN